MKLFLTLSGMAALIAGMTLDVMGHTGSLVAGFLAFCLLLCCANLDRIAEFQASAGSITAKTRDVVERAETAISELQVLACQVSRLSLSLVARQGRIGAYTDHETTEMVESTRDVLKKLKIKESDIHDALSDWYLTTEFDYAHCIIGRSFEHGAGDAQARGDWEALRTGHIRGRPTPDAIRDFLVRHNLMDSVRQEYLADYEHYIAHREHRRPDVWERREEWGRQIPKRPS